MAELDHSPSERKSSEYLAQLLSDKKQLQIFPPKMFMHLEKILDEEISKVRGSLFQLSKIDDPHALPQAVGPSVTLSEKLMVPVNEYPDFNFVGRILGPRGLTAKQLENDTGCKIMVRGKGSMRDKQKEEQNRGKTNWEHLNEDLHVLISVEDSENRAHIKLQRAIDEVKKLLVPMPDGEDDLKRRQLMELAIINGTYRDTATAGANSAVVGPQSVLAAVPVPVSQGSTRFITPTPIAAAAMPSVFPAVSVQQGTPIFLAPRIPRLGSVASSLSSATVLTCRQPAPVSVSGTAAAAGSLLYPIDPYVQQIFEYSAGLQRSATGSVSNYHRIMTQRDHPYLR